MKIEFKRIDHVQICIPKGEEKKGRKFYCDILGLKEVERPESLIMEEGFWLEVGNTQIHISTEDLSGTSKRHPAFEIKELDKVREYLIKMGVKIKDQVKITGTDRFTIFDYWDNRIELLQRS